MINNILYYSAIVFPLLTIIANLLMVNFHNHFQTDLFTLLEDVFPKSRKIKRNPTMYHKNLFVTKWKDTKKWMVANNYISTIGSALTLTCTILYILFSK